jgi:hypothetical protein
MHFHSVITVFVTIMLAIDPIYAQDDPKLTTIKRLGELNGVALQCKLLADTQRIKRSLVRNLPKRRQLGELFDQETNRSFMRFMQNNDNCPSVAVFQQQVDAAISELEEAYRDVAPN